jgi:hypothetical protein
MANATGSVCVVRRDGSVPMESWEKAREREGDGLRERRLSVEGGCRRVGTAMAMGAVRVTAIRARDVEHRSG